MDMPVPPQDEELRNIIEKLAVFVARNGQEFEAMTKQKQRNNPRFAFLFGGEFYNYYMYRVTTEQAILKHKASRDQHGPPGNFGPPGFSNNAGPGGMLNQQQQPRFSGHQQMFDQQPRGSLAMQGFDRGGFDTRPPLNFERLGGPGQGGMQSFERPPMNRMPFQQHGPPRGPSNFGAGNFERPPQVGSFEQTSQGGGNFDRSVQGGSFERPTQGGGGGRNFEHAAQGGSFERPPQSGNFERPPQVGNFDRPSPAAANFERLPQAGNFERPPQAGNGPNLDVDQRQNFQAPAASFERVAPQSFSQSFPVVQSQSPAITVAVAPSQTPPAPSINLEALQTQKKTFEEQIRQSEQNLAGQHQVLLAQQQKQIEESIRIMQDADIQKLAEELNVNLEEFDAVLQPIVESCTKDAISSGKAWIFTHTPTKRHYQLVSQFLLRKTTDPDAAFNKRLHIIYLVNDVLHHCMRKGADDLQAVLENMVIPMFCHAKVSEMSSIEHTERLDKLLTLWESKSSYVSSTAVEKLRNFNSTWQDYQTELLQRFAGIVTQIAASINQTYEGYQTQHQLFCQHVNQNIKALEQQIQQALVQQQLQIQQQQQQQQQLQLQQQIQLQQQQQQQQLSARPPGIPPVMANVPPGMGPVPIIGAPANPQIVLPNVQVLGAQMFTGYPNQGQIPTQGFPPSIAPLGMELQGPPVPGMFDLSKPPPGFGAPITPPPEADLIPKIEYYELPAGLMVPLVKPEDDNYKPVDPKAIRLPPPCPPSDRLLQAVEAFYAPATHERPRDSEGWERLGLYEYFKSKNLARKQKEDDIRDGRRQKSRSPTPIKRELSPTTTRSPPRRRYQSKSPTPPRRRRSRSRSPPPGRRKRNSRRSRSRSRSPEPLRRRSPTPPSFTTAGLGMERKLDETNKGHQLLKKMGWSGSGLGRDEQGIEAPISGGELRDKKDQYRGVGTSTMNDPFESYRKSKGQAFVERMRARAEERL